MQISPDYFVRATKTLPSSEKFNKSKLGNFGITYFALSLSLNVPLTCSILKKKEHDVSNQRTDGGCVYSGIRAQRLCCRTIPFP